MAIAIPRFSLPEPQIRYNCRVMRITNPETWPQRPLIMGIVNVTPDSFSDGGHYATWPKAVSHALQLVAEGADILDIGGESTRPGAKPVPVDLEIERTARVVEALKGETHVPLSIDTRKPEVAEEALARGASIVNDVTGFGDGRMAELVVDHGAVEADVGGKVGYVAVGAGS